jgi:VWFA-related protein
MQHLIVATLLALVAIADPSGRPDVQATQPAQDATRTPRASDKRTRDIYVSVVDNTGKPVTGLTAADFTVREDGVAREVVSATQATEPLTISVLVDDSAAATEAIQFIRDALLSFVQRLSGKAEIAIATIGERPTSQIDYTTSTEALKKTIGRIFQKTGSGAYFLDGIVEVSRGLQKREAKRPTIVAITSEEGPEFSNRSYQQVLEVLLGSGAALHVLALGSPSSSLGDEMRNRNITIAEGTEKTGGRRDQVLALSGLTDRLNQVADELTSQYVVQYGRPDQLIPPEKVQVAVTRPGLTVRARTRATDK